MLDLEDAQQQCIERLSWSMEQLGVVAEPEQLADLAELIVECMTGPNRYYHVPKHIFELSENGDEIEVVAALFHDLVYIQVDEYLSVNLSFYVASSIKEVHGKLRLRDAHELAQDPYADMVAMIFGFQPQQALSPLGGQNEFLSAVVATKAMSGLLSMPVLAQIIACIEATVPFRSKSPDGLTASELLHHRLIQANQKFDLGLSDAELITVVKRSVQMANRDVENFADVSAARFLDNTWSLLPETNPSLKHPNSYTVRQYRLALEKMEAMMHRLSGELVFRRFQDEPDLDTYQRWVDRTNYNIAVARLYLGSKLAAIAILEALSLRLGQDIPLSTLIGELSLGDGATGRWETLLPAVSTVQPPETDLEAEVLELLDKGRSRDFFYDTRNSPLATYLVKSLGFAGTRALLEKAKQFFRGQLSAPDFLAACNADALQTVTDAVSKFFESRKTALQQELVDS